MRSIPFNTRQMAPITCLHMVECVLGVLYGIMPRWWNVNIDPRNYLKPPLVSGMPVCRTPHHHLAIVQCVVDHVDSLFVFVRFARRWKAVCPYKSITRMPPITIPPPPFLTPCTSCTCISPGSHVHTYQAYIRCIHAMVSLPMLP